jgi:flavin-dependent dehydrogenase
MEGEGIEVPLAGAPERVRVVVIGAGWSGLYVAKRLIEFGIDVVVLEKVSGAGVGLRLNMMLAIDFQVVKGDCSGLSYIYIYIG